MSHFVETMAYAGETPWHRLGKHIGAEDVDGKTMMVAAGLDWKVRKSPVFTRDENTGVYTPISGQYGMVRDIDNRPLSNVTVGARYHEFQNSDLFDIGDALRSAAGGDVKFHTAGSLKGGQRVWALCQVAGEINVQRRGGDMDRSVPFLLLSAGHDGRSPIIVASTPVRVVCWNTFSAALAGNAAAHSIRHTRNADQRVIEATKALGYSLNYFGEFADVAQTLADTPMSKESFAVFCAQLLTGEDDKSAALEAVAKSEGRSKTILENKADDLWTRFVRGRGNRGQDAYDALNAVTEAVDHAKATLARSQQTRERLESGLISAQFGTGADLKARALKLLTR